MGSVALVVVGLDFCTDGFVRIVHRVVKSNHLRVVCTVIIVMVVKADVQTVNAGVDDRNGDT